MDTGGQPLHQERLLRLSQVLNLLQIGKSSWWAGIKAGRYPQPVRLGGCTRWRQSDILRLMERGSK
jgi:predicted DNA-binding transcriptional regulator AlpA